MAATLPPDAAADEPAHPATKPGKGARAATSGKGEKKGAAPKPAKEPKAPKPKKEKAVKEKKAKKMSCLDAAAQVLAASEVPMKATEMIAKMEAKGLWKSGKGLTPEATLYAAIIREIAAKGREARFKKHDRGMFVAGRGRPESWTLPPHPDLHRRAWDAGPLGGPHAASPTSTAARWPAFRPSRTPSTSLRTLPFTMEELRTNADVAFTSGRSRGRLHQGARVGLPGTAASTRRHQEPTSTP